MQMEIRIKASDEFADLFALKLAGGWQSESGSPKFHFHNGLDRQKYENIRKQFKEMDANGGSPTTSTQKAYESARINYRRDRGIRI